MMSFTTYFQFTHTSSLPLPPPHHRNDEASPIITPETPEEILERGIRTAIALLHQPEIMIGLNPLVQHYNVVKPMNLNAENHMVNLAKLAPEFNVALSDPPHSANFEKGAFVHYEIVDKFQFAGLSKLMNYRAAFRELHDDSLNTLGSKFKGASLGLETISDPGNGVALLGKWVVGLDERKPGFLVLKEIVSVHCNVFLGWYVKSQLQSAHAALHDEFLLRFRQRMMAEDPCKDLEGRKGKTWQESREELGSRQGTNEF